MATQAPVCSSSATCDHLPFTLTVTDGCDHPASAEVHGKAQGTKPRSLPAELSLLKPGISDYITGHFCFQEVDVLVPLPPARTTINLGHCI